jgi:hypothetical protein
MVRAKLTCVCNDEQQGVVLRPVVDGSEENKQFFKYTPGGQVQLNVLNEAASAQFEVGKEYYADFTPADK